MSHRLFIAITLPRCVRGQLIHAMDGIENACWQTEDQLHLTLRFVGEIDSPVANDLADALGRVRADKFALKVAGVGHFSRKGAPSAVWAAIAPSPALTVFQRRLESACRSAGLPAETRRFIPHVTLARLNRDSGPVGEFLTSHGTLASNPFPVSGFTLFESHLGRSGSIYEPVMQYRLG